MNEWDLGAMLTLTGMMTFGLILLWGIRKREKKCRSYPPWLAVQIVSITSFLFIIPIYLILINNLSIITIFLVAGLMFLLLMIIKQSIQMLKLHYFHWRRNEKTRYNILK